MSNKVTRRTFIKRIFGGFLAAAGAGAGGYYYSSEIEPGMLEIAKHPFKNDRLPAGFNGFRIIQFSDTHIGFQYRIDQLEQHVDKINKMNPDMIVFTGDLLDDPMHFKSERRVISALSRLKAPFGKFAVYGNHDHGGYGSDLYKQVMEQAGFKLLQNHSVRIKMLDGSSLWIAGIDDAMLGKPDITSAMAGIPEDGFTILLSHAPDLADAASAFPISLQLSGHSHGGQIQIPFYGPLVTPPYAEKYVEGFYSVGQDKGLTLYVNRGLGTTRLPYRFLSEPEISLFTLNREETSS